MRAHYFSKAKPEIQNQPDLIRWFTGGLRIQTVLELNLLVLGNVIDRYRSVRYRAASMPSWKEFYQAAKAKTNPKFLAHLLDEAEVAMWNRLQNLDRAKPDEHTERCEIEAASVAIFKLRTEKLGWPDPLKSSVISNFHAK
jgi:hypothetical protein